MPAASVTLTVKAYVAAVVGVPDSRPALDSVRPAGTVPTTTAYVYGAVPPVAENWWLYGAATWPLGAVSTKDRATPESFRPAHVGGYSGAYARKRAASTSLGRTLSAFKYLSHSPRLVRLDNEAPAPSATKRRRRSSSLHVLPAVAWESSVVIYVRPWPCRSSVEDGRPPCCCPCGFALPDSSGQCRRPLTTASCG